MVGYMSAQNVSHSTLTLDTNRCVMKISASELDRQYDRANETWDFIKAVEANRNLPRLVLFAVGSRESNLRNIVGDGGHGYGVWQRDNRSWGVDRKYLDSVLTQARDAGDLLAANFKRFENWRHAIAAYNAGAGAVARALRDKKDPDQVTTGRDYSRDVWERRAHLVTQLPVYPGDLIKRGSDGANVRLIQKRLRRFGAELELDGDFGHMTEDAVKDFQQQRLLLPTDGIVGFKTWSQLF